MRVDRCRDMDELITFEPDPDHHMGYGTLQPCLSCQRAALLRGILRRVNLTYTFCRSAARASRVF